MSIRSAKPVRAWAIVHWNGGIYANTVSNTRRDAVATFKAAYRVRDKKWRHDVKWNIHRAVKVTVTVGG